MMAHLPHMNKLLEFVAYVYNHQLNLVHINPHINLISIEYFILYNLNKSLYNYYTLNYLDNLILIINHNHRNHQPDMWLALHTMFHSIYMVIHNC